MNSTSQLQQYPQQQLQGSKLDLGKTRMDLLDPLWLEEVAKVMTFGATKYDAHDWRKGIQFSRVLAALLRHVFAILKGQDRDAETGLLHSAHASANLMFLTNFYTSHPEFDDRYRNAPTPPAQPGGLR